MLEKKGLAYNNEMADKTTGFESVAVMAHPQVAAAASEAAHVAEYLRERAVNAVDGYLNDEGLRQRVRDGEFDLVITLGGDGTVLRAGHLCAPFDVPILAINMGSFGFLIEVPQKDWKSPLERLLADEYWIENRMMLHTKVWRGEELLDEWDVLNDTVIARDENLRPVHLSASLDGQAVTTYVADALIVATPTGSTAYALAAGGPILPPELRNILLMPVAPHLSVDRAIVLAEGSKVSVTVLSDQEAVVSGDGQAPVRLIKNDRVEVCASQYTVRFVRFKEVGYFYHNLVTLMDQHPSTGANK